MITAKERKLEGLAGYSAIMWGFVLASADGRSEWGPQGERETLLYWVRAETKSMQGWDVTCVLHCGCEV